MTPYKIELYVYAETPEQAKQAQDIANRLVAQEYRRGCSLLPGRWQRPASVSPETISSNNF